MNHKLVIHRSIDEFTDPSLYLEYVESLRIRKESKTKLSKVVPDVSITWNKKIIVKVRRPNKRITIEELALLVIEHNKTSEELTALFTQRKIAIVNSEGVVLNAKPPKARSGRPAKKPKDSKKNAVSNEHRHSDDSLNKLIEP